MKAILKLVACAIVLAGCRGKKQEASSGDAVVAPGTTAMPVTQASWDPDAIDEIVAPIALYPDQLVGQILAASVNTQEVLDAGNWLLENQTLKGDQLDAAAQKAGFGPATRALLQFPTVVDMMCQEIDWTKQVGAAFTSDQKGVLDAIQRLRAQAADVGNLKTTPQQTVEHRKDEGKEVIEVKPADPKVVYVPQYDPTIIYTTPPPSTPAPAPAPAPAPQPNTVSTSTAIAGGLLAFGVGVLVGSAISNNNDITTRTMDQARSTMDLARSTHPRTCIGQCTDRRFIPRTATLRRRAIGTATTARPTSSSTTTTITIASRTRTTFASTTSATSPRRTA